MSDDEHNSAMDTNDNSDSNENSVSKTMGIFLSFFVCVTKQSERKKSFMELTAFVDSIV